MTPPATTAKTLARVADLRDRLEAALSEILEPELAGRPFRIALASELPADSTNGSWFGMFAPRMGAAVQSLRGEPPQADCVCIILNDAAIVQDVERPDDIDATANAFSAHESSHAIAYCLEPPDNPSDDYRELQTRVALKALAGPFDPITEHDVEPWFGHGPEFIRAALHIGHRLRRRGFYCPVSRIFDHATYGLASSAEWYWGAGIREESEALEDLALSSVLALPPPPEFERVWNRDIADYKTAHSNLKETTTMGAMATFFDKFRTTRARQEAQGAKTFRQLARQIADGKEPEVKTAAEILETTGRTIDDLEKAAAQIITRRQLRDRLDAGPGAQERLQELEKEEEQEAERFCRIELEHLEIFATIGGQKEHARLAVVAAESAASELERTCTDPELLSELRRLDEQLRTEATKLTEVRAYRKRYETVVASHVDTLEQNRRKFSAAVLANDIALAEGHQQKLNAVDEQIREMERNIEELKAAREEIRRKMLDPNAV